MVLKVPKYCEDESSIDLEEMIKPSRPRTRGTFHTRQKPDYSSLIEEIERDKVKCD